MTITYKSPADRLAARQKAKLAKAATTQAKAAVSYRRQAASLRAGGYPEAEALRYEASAEKCEQWLVEKGRCMRCGRALSDPKSVTGSIGPECARKAAL